MKIRNGFISNSSSSSFILNIWGWDEEDIEDIYKYIRRVMNNSRKKDIQQAIAEGSKTEEEIRKWYGDEYSMEEIKKWIKVDTVGNLIHDLDFWYAPCDLVIKDNLVICDTVDNYIPYDICKKIIKKYNIRRYNLHMG